MCTMSEPRTANVHHEKKRLWETEIDNCRHDIQGLSVWLNSQAAAKLPRLYCKECSPQHLRKQDRLVDLKRTCAKAAHEHNL
jgi:hypothetical protein